MELEMASDAKQRVTLMTLLAEYYLNHVALDMARNYAWEANDVCINKGLEVPVPLHFVRSRIFNELMSPWEASQEIEAAMKKIPDEDEVLKAEAQNYEAKYAMHMGKFMESVRLYKENLVFCDSNNLDFHFTEALYGLANVHNAIGDQEKEIEYLNDYIAKIEDLKDSARLERGYFRLGEIYLSDSSFGLSEQNYLKSFAIDKALRDTTKMAFAMLRVAWVNFLHKDIGISIQRYNEALEYARRAGRKQSITNALGNLGTIYRDLGEFDKAIESYRESIKLSEEVADYYNLSWVYQDMSSMYAELKDFENAFKYYKLYKSYYDSLENQRFRIGLERARTLFETERKQKELEMVSLKLKQNQNFVYGLTGLIVLLILIAVLIIRQIRISSQKRISEMNHELSELTQKNLRQQMNPHFIFNTLNSIQYYMYQHDKIATNDYMSKFSSLMRKTLENSRYTSIQIKDELDALQLYLDLEALRFKHKFSYVIEVDDEIDVLMHKIPTMLIQPYVENSICHGLMHRENADGLVKVTLKLEKSTIVCTIEDNGIGREAAIEIKNRNNNNHKSLGTTITESRLKIVNSLYGSKMKIDFFDLKDEDGKPLGTKVVIHIPIIT
ncbi:MAG: histidine kinase [Bacteroidales bacterium]|nr:histidine kinase [Bacteroidales bacterium]